MGRVTVWETYLCSGGRVPQEMSRESLHLRDLPENRRFPSPFEQHDVNRSTLCCYQSSTLGLYILMWFHNLGFCHEVLGLNLPSSCWLLCKPNLSSTCLKLIDCVTVLIPWAYMLIVRPRQEVSRVRRDVKQSKCVTAHGDLQQDFATWDSLVWRATPGTFHGTGRLSFIILLMLGKQWKTMTNHLHVSRHPNCPDMYKIGTWLGNWQNNKFRMFTRFQLWAHRYFVKWATHLCCGTRPYRPHGLSSTPSVYYNMQFHTDLVKEWETLWLWCTFAGLIKSNMK